MTATITMELDGKQYTVTDDQDGENAAWAFTENPASPALL